jgi:uncharacterized membrane protein
VSRYDWLLFLHVASAFALISAVVLASVLLIVVRNRDVPSEVARLFRLTRLGDILGGVGSVGALVFGIWLAIDVKGYELWDGWIIAAFVLWVVIGAFAGRTGKVINGVRDRARALAAEGGDAPNAELRSLVRDPRGLWLHAATAAAVLLLLIDMIFKPGA